MNIALLFRGPLRPNAQSTGNCIAALKKHLSHPQHSITTYLSTWLEPNLEQSLNELGRDKVENFNIIPYPTTDFMGEEIASAMLPHGTPARNCFYQYYMCKLAIENICAHRTYDLIVHSRTDLYINLGTFIDRWLSPCGSDEYKTLHTKKDSPTSFINDQFSVASPQVMRTAWDYGHTADLKEKIKTAHKAEDVLQSMIDNAGINDVHIPIVDWHLDAQRHASIPAIN